VFHPPHAVLSHAPLARVALRVTVACVAVLVLSARTASSQQPRKVLASKATASKATATPAQAATSTADSSVVCDSVATPPAAPRKQAVARVHKPRPRRVAAASATPRVAVKPRPAKPALALAKKRPTAGHAAGRRVAGAPAARTSPPRCHKVAAARVPEVGAMADLVNSLPWTPPADVTFPLATAPSLADFTEGVALRTGTLAAGLLGAGAFWLGSSDRSEAPPEIIVTPPPGGETPPPVTTVPEPATLALVASGLAAIGARARRRMR